MSTPHWAAKRIGDHCRITMHARVAEVMQRGDASPRDAEASGAYPGGRPSV